MIDHLLTESWTVLVNTETVDNSSTVVDSWATDTSIGTSGVIKAHYRNLSIREQLQNARDDISLDGRLYTKSSGITIKHRIQDSDDQVYNVIAVDNPHNQNEFFQIDLLRTDSERDADG